MSKVSGGERANDVSWEGQGRGAVVIRSSYIVVYDIFTNVHAICDLTT